MQQSVHRDPTDRQQGSTEAPLRTTGALHELTLLAHHCATQFATIAFQVRSAITTEPIAFGWTWSVKM
jgi:hypothetical protein